MFFDGFTSLDYEWSDPLHCKSFRGERPSIEVTTSSRSVLGELGI
jgi:hypothetical protein